MNAPEREGFIRFDTAGPPEVGLNSLWLRPDEIRGVSELKIVGFPTTCGIVLPSGNHLSVQHTAEEVFRKMEEFEKAQ